MKAKHKGCCRRAEFRKKKQKDLDRRRKCFAKMVPRILSEKQQRPLQVVAGNENWCFQYDQETNQSMQWQKTIHQSQEKHEYDSHKNIVITFSQKSTRMFFNIFFLNLN